jgi:hypothetical protein
VIDSLYRANSDLDQECDCWGSQTIHKSFSLRQLKSHTSSSWSTCHGIINAEQYLPHSVSPQPCASEFFRFRQMAWCESLESPIYRKILVRDRPRTHGIISLSIIWSPGLWPSGLTQCSAKVIGLSVDSACEGDFGTRWRVTEHMWTMSLRENKGSRRGENADVLNQQLLKYRNPSDCWFVFCLTLTVFARVDFWIGNQTAVVVDSRDGPSSGLFLLKS